MIYIITIVIKKLFHLGPQDNKMTKMLIMYIVKYLGSRFFHYWNFKKQGPYLQLESLLRTGYITIMFLLVSSILFECFQFHTLDFNHSIYYCISRFRILNNTK